MSTIYYVSPNTPPLATGNEGINDQIVGGADTAHKKPALIPRGLPRGRVYIGADHAGFDLKENIKAKLKENGYEVEDLTPGPVDPNDDYPGVAEKVAQAVLADNAKGILLCGSGNGICAAANKIKGIRAALGFNTQAAKWAREHLDANILCLAGRVLSPDYAQVIVKDWLATPFTGEERHARRIEQIKKMEEL